jgi:hypothetical protein
MLLDTHAIRSTLIQILPTSAPFQKRVTAAMVKPEPLLKTLQVRPSPPEALVQAYLIHIADLSDANFRKILEMKGIRARSTESNHLVELYQMHKLSPRYKDSLVEKSSLLTPLNITAGTTGVGAAGVPTAALQNVAASLSTANLPANLQLGASGIGNAINRFTSPHIGTPREERAMSPPMNGTDANPSAETSDRLRNIGRFFRRDMGGLSGLGTRFGSGGGSNAVSPAPPLNRDGTS